MVNGLEGIPGSGKSYEACVFHVLEALKAGRKVITNLPLVLERFAAIDPMYVMLIEVRTMPAPVRGTFDITAAGTERPLFIPFEDGHTEAAPVTVPVFGHVWDYYSDWKGKDGNGPLYVIDECHVSLPKIGTPNEVIVWYKQHRHFNADVLLMTQSFRQMCPSVADLMGVVVKVRKADILGKADHYIRKVLGGYRGAVISTEQRKYQPQYFGLYKSHTQGNSVAERAASDVKPFLVRFNRLRNVFLLVGIGAVLYAFVPWQSMFGGPPKVAPAAVASAASAASGVSRGGQGKPETNQVVATNGKAASAPGPAASDPAFPDPYASQLLHVTGTIQMRGKVVSTFALSSAGRLIGSVTDAELRAAGYTVERLNDCAVMLRFHGKARPVICDAPDAPTGNGLRPVVVADGSGRRSDERPSGL